MEKLRATYTNVATPSYQFFFAWKLFIFGFVFLNLWALLGEDALPPNGTYFHLLMIFIAAHFCAKVSSFLNLPALFGMLVAGFIYGNVLDVELDKTITSGLRSLALMIILLRAGLSLDPSAIKKLSFVCFRLAFGPCLVEAVTVALCAFFLFELNLSWSLMLGFVLAAVSPAVVVPGMIKLQESKLGVSKGIPTLIIAAASIDDVLAITGFSVCLSFAFAKSNDDSKAALAWSILKGPTEAAIGVVYGLVMGIVLWYIPQQCNTKNRNETSSKYDLYRLVIFLLAGTFALFASLKFDLSGSGPLAILVLSFVASLRWRPVGFDVFNEDSLKMLWEIFQHFLFALIGADVRIKTMQSDVLLYGLLCLFVGIFLRVIAAFLVTYGIGLHYRERLFTAIAWLPKATVQAAIGPVALDSAVTPEDINKGRLVLTIAVLSILITAPLGAIAIDYFAPLMLNNEEADECETNDDCNPDDRSNEESSSIEMEQK